METVFSTYTMAVMFVCAVACAAAGASYLLTRNRICFCATVAFFLYYFDLSLIFLTENLNHGEPITLQSLYSVNMPYLKAVVAGGILESLWIALCIYLDEDNIALRLAPLCTFIVADFSIAAFMGEGPVKQWLFFSMREAFLIWCLIYLVYKQCSPSTTNVQRTLIARQRKLILTAAILTCCIIAENSIVILAWRPSDDALASMLPIYISERNLSENILIIVFAVVAIHNAMGRFRLRHVEPPSAKNEPQKRYVEDSFQMFCERNNLTAREREVLRGIIDGKDNQNIASEFNLAIGTVKSHTHNIFRKANVNTRQELLQKFWRN